MNNSSGAGVKAFGHGAAYAAAKHGLVGLTKDAALDCASSNIRVEAVCSGIDTEMMHRFTGGTTEGRDRVIAQEPIGRMGTPDEIAAAVCGRVLKQPPSSSATPWSSMAARRSDRLDARAGGANADAGTPHPETGQKLHLEAIQNCSF